MGGELQTALEVEEGEVVVERCGIVDGLTDAA